MVPVSLPVFLFISASWLTAPRCTDRVDAGAIYIRRGSTCRRTPIPRWRQPSAPHARASGGGGRTPGRSSPSAERARQCSPNRGNIDGVSSSATSRKVVVHSPLLAGPWGRRGCCHEASRGAMPSTSSALRTLERSA